MICPRWFPALPSGALLLIACAAPPEDPHRKAAADAIYAALSPKIATMLESAKALQDAAPTPSGRGWDRMLDADSLRAVTTAWLMARHAYEPIEGVVAVLMPALDVSLDDRYDGFLTSLHGKGDPNPFDDQGVVGMHAIERILYADVTPKRVSAYEATLAGHTTATVPSTEAEAADFRANLCGKLIRDAELLVRTWSPRKIDAADAFRGLVVFLGEQREKVEEAAFSADESRYSQRTLADLRANTAGVAVIYEAYRPWLQGIVNTIDPARSGESVDANILDGLNSLSAMYEGLAGDAIPEAPVTWNPAAPSDADLASPYGMLRSAVDAALDPVRSDSVMNAMTRAAELLDISLVTSAPR